ncbi:protein FAR-RED IMPAIRED RESPONSE 1-like [Carya illinoinensis]|uniref:protein FAR-RED IMPAIRED RESPONSE 1-like n=1 Tax=Carya illinoinensis TaxID=32201 RepID=UPI001C71DD86|nr:protein FAR-RED IMPAIRED RESPONSE 1-like [Carya illinoinensis]
MGTSREVEEFVESGHGETSKTINESVTVDLSTSKEGTSLNSNKHDIEQVDCTTPIEDCAMKIVDEPKSGMTFKDEATLSAYYKRYAKQEGFGVRIQRTKRVSNGAMKYITLGCSRGGKHTSSSSNVSKPGPTTKIECKAKINARLNNGEWCLTSLELNHNHGLNPLVPRYFRCHRNIDSLAKWKLELNDKAEIRMNKNYYSFIVEAGGFDNLQFTEKDCRNFIDKARHLCLGKGGGVALLEYFERMRDMNHDFYSITDLDEEEFRLKNVFWADARSRASYLYFGDVVTFDTTYLTNRYRMSFAPFVGVNHHGQSILLGVGLISSEDTHTFVWLFSVVKVYGWPSTSCNHNRSGSCNE